MLKVTKIALAVLTVVLAGLFALTFVQKHFFTDSTPPVISFDSDVLEISVRTKQEELLSGVTAWDDSDGDLAANLAVSLAQNGSKVILVDADLRLQSLRRFFRVRHESRGLVDALEAQNPYLPGFLTDVGVENLKLISGGSSAASFSILRSKKIKNIFEKLRDMADYVIVDTPPSGMLSDAESFIRYSDGVIYVIKAEYASRSQIIDNIQSLSENRAEMIGYVIGGVRQTGGNYGYGYGSKYGYNYKSYGYNYGKEGKE